jgi:hypothetical protein
MSKKFSLSTLIVVFISGLASNASATAITDPNVVGVITGAGGTTLAEDMTAAQHLLTMLASTSDSNGPTAGGVACDYNADPGCYATSATEYLATLTATGAVRDSDNTIDAGFQYALVRYDGAQGGFILYYLNGAAKTLTDSSPLWTNGSGGFEVVYYSAFNTTVGTNVTVPDGGMTLALLGAALGGLGLVRRRFKA